MAIKITFTKQLGTASANNICTTQTGSAGTPLVLNGSATNYLSTTSSAAAAVGATVINLSSVTGVTVGQSITDTTATTLPAQTVVSAVGTASVSIWPPVGGANGVGSGDTIVFPGTATIDTFNATTNIAIGRRIAIAYTGTDTSFTIVGTNANGNGITDTAVGASGAAQSNLDFLTVTSITPVGGGLTGVTVGTNGVGSSQWFTWNWRGYAPMSLGLAVELVSGSVNFSVQHTYDDPNNLLAGSGYPLPFNDPVIASQNTTISNIAAPFTTAIAASRLLINSGTGEVRVRFEQAGVG
jgi:hypothetical protein